MSSLKAEVKDLNDLFDLLCKMQEICPTDDNGNKTYAVSMFSDWDGDTVNFLDLVKAYYGMESWGFGFYHPVTQEYYDIFDERSHYIGPQILQQVISKGIGRSRFPDTGLERFYRGCAEWHGIVEYDKLDGQRFYNTDTHLSEKAMFSLFPRTLWF